MRFRLALLVAVTSFLTVPSWAHALPRPAYSAAEDAAVVDQMMYHTSLSSFVSIATHGPDPQYDWTTDFCSAPLVGNTGRSFNFTSPCRRHDFGYRNLRLLEQRYGSGSTYWNGASRKRVDQQFLADMKGHCAGRSILLRPTCYAWAETFYAAVRLVGGP